MAETVSTGVLGSFRLLFLRISSFLSFRFRRVLFYPPPQAKVAQTYTRALVNPRPIGGGGEMAPTLNPKISPKLKQITGKNLSYLSVNDSTHCVKK